MGLEDTLDGKTFEGEEYLVGIRVSVRTCLGSRLQKAPLSNILCQFGGAIHKVNYPQQHCLFSFISTQKDVAFTCFVLLVCVNESGNFLTKM